MGDKEFFTKCLVLAGLSSSACRNGCPYSDSAPWNRFAVSSVFLPPSPRAPRRTDIHSTKASGSAGPLLADPLFCPHGKFADVILQTSPLYRPTASVSDGRSPSGLEPLGPPGGGVRGARLFHRG